jgi:sulfur relay (sulfurtransferase) DsrF/TusC family protein
MAAAVLSTSRGRALAVSTARPHKGNNRVFCTAPNSDACVVFAISDNQVLLLSHQSPARALQPRYSRMKA